MVIIKEAILQNIGCFKNETFTFEKGLNVFYGDNESGKSTLQLFIKAMLYGAQKTRKTTDSVKEVDRLIAWGEKSGQGILRLIYNGREIEVRRKFARRTTADAEVLDVATGEPLAEFEDGEIGERLFGASVAVFEKTFWLKQNGTAMWGKSEELSRKLMNIEQSGDEDVSIERGVKEIENLKKSIKAPDKRSNEGQLDILQDSLTEKIQEKYHLITALRQREREESRMEDAKQSLKRAEEEQERLKALAEKQKNFKEIELKADKWIEIEALLRKKEELKENISQTKGAELDEDSLKEAEIMSREEETLDQTTKIGYDKERISFELRQREAEKKRSGIALVFGALIFVFSVALTFKNFFGLIGCFIGIFVIAFGVYGYKKSEKAIDEIGHSLTELEKLIQKENKEREERKAKVLRICIENGCENVKELREVFEKVREWKGELETIEKAYSSIIGDDDPNGLKDAYVKAEEFKGKNSELFEKDYSKELEKNQKLQLELSVSVKELEGKLSYVFNGEKNPADVESEISAIKDDISKLEKEYKAAELALDVLKDVHQRMKSDFAPVINKEAGKYLERLTKGKYKNIRVAEDYHIKMIHDAEELHEAEYFSLGTYEQIYLALRLAMAHMPGGEGVPIFLDDFLMSYDDKRQNAAIELLSELAKKRQIIAFTCHSRDVNNAEKYGSAIHKLKEE